jgi:hypothetical protein
MSLPLLFVALAITVAFLFLVGVYRAWRSEPKGATVFLATLIASTAWMVGTYVAASKGALRFDTRPPTIMLMIGAVFVIAFAAGLSHFGKQLALGLPLAALVGFQAFRFPLELLMHRAYAEGLMPVQMSYSGRNFDIITGMTAAVLGLVLWKREVSPWFVRLWHVMGVLLLANILTVAMLSTPMPFRKFWNEPANVWITQVPYVWLPAVFVLFAILGHVLIARRLTSDCKLRRTGVN